MRKMKDRILIALAKLCAVLFILGALSVGTEGYFVSSLVICCISATYLGLFIAANIERV